MKDRSRNYRELNVLIPVAKRFLRPRNTDWHYAARTLLSLSDYCPCLRVSAQNNLLADVETNLRYGLLIARRRGIGVTPRAWDYDLAQDCPLWEGDMRGADAAAVLSYERFPANAYGRPVVWITSHTRPDQVRELGGSTAEFDRIVRWKRSRALGAAKLVFTTSVAMDLFLQQCGESLRDKCVVIPFLLPGLCAVKEISSKWSQNVLRLLFVGRQARRKGLPAVLEAVVPLLRENRNVFLTIVSSMDDGPVDVPNLPNIEVMGETSRSQVLRLMSESHVLVNPSSWESYGFVYIEAMSQACIPLALDSPVQRELIGADGILVSSQSPEEIRAAVMRVLSERDLYFRKSRSGLQSFRERHSAGVVASKFYEAILSTQGRVVRPKII